jgi:hypothetical protein
VDDRVGTVERAADRVPVANVADVELDVRSEVVGALAVDMHLAVEVVQGADVVPVGEQSVGEVRADEPRPSGDQNAHGRAGGYLREWTV